jgi:hypothetical protein
MGGMLVVHGGFNSDENYMYNQIEICDLSNLDLMLTFLAYKKWLVGQLKVHVDKSKKTMEEVELPDPKDIQPGYLQMHSMISLTDDYSLDNS